MPVADQDLTDVAWTVSTMGKFATEQVLPVLPRGTSGILGVGRTDKETGKSMMIMSMCHGTLTGMDGAGVMNNFAEKLRNC